MHRFDQPPIDLARAADAAPAITGLHSATLVANNINERRGRVMTAKYTKTIICLANSRKRSGRCVAGKEIVAGKIGGWIRPISARPAGELSEGERRLDNGQEPKLLDVIQIAMSRVICRISIERRCRMR
jgi:hypothetical protein